MHRLVLTTLTATLLSLAFPIKAQPGWQQYTLAERGIRAMLPTKPQRRELPLASGDGTLTVYEAIETANPPGKYSIFVGTPERQGIFEADSMDAYLSSHVASMVRAAESGKLLGTTRTTFRGRPAIEYQFAHRIEGIAYIGRGITLMIDGGHIRLSMWHPASDGNAKDNYRRFVDSFEIVPIQFSAAPTRFSDARGITFSPPVGWVSQAGANPIQAVRYSNLTRSLQLLVAGVPTYTCENFLAEMKASGRVKEAGMVMLAERQVLRILSFEDLPKYNVRLTTVQYCRNSRSGAVVLGGSEEEAMFARWAKVYEGAAATLQVP